MPFITTSFVFAVVQSLSRVWLFVTPWTAARQASLSITNSWSLLTLMSIESVMPSNHLICRPLLLPSVFPSISVFSNELALCIRWPTYWSFSISPSSEYSGLISLSTDWFDCCQSESCSVMSNSLRLHGLQHARFPCPSPTPRACSHSCPLSRWCQATISSSVVSSSSCLQAFPAPGSFPMSGLFTSGGQSIGASASASVLPVNIHDWFHRH